MKKHSTNYQRTDLIELALKNRFELEVALARVQKAEAQAFIEGVKAWPRLSQIRVGYEMRLGQDFEGAVTGGLSLEVPLFNLNGGARDEANAREVLRKAELEEEVESVIVEVETLQTSTSSCRGSHHTSSRCQRSSSKGYRGSKSFNASGSGRYQRACGDRITRQRSPSAVA